LIRIASRGLLDLRGDVDQNPSPRILRKMQLQYRERADLAEQNADLCADPKMRREFLMIADRWRRLACFTDATAAPKDWDGVHPASL
jgi:hypothetical protein